VFAKQSVVDPVETVLDVEDDEESPGMPLGAGPPQAINAGVAPATERVAARWAAREANGGRMSARSARSTPTRGSP
jgi:hypothetical protein